MMSKVYGNRVKYTKDMLKCNPDILQASYNKLKEGLRKFRREIYNKLSEMYEQKIACQSLVCVPKDKKSTECESQVTLPIRDLLNTIDVYSDLRARIQEAYEEERELIEEEREFHQMKQKYGS